VLLQVGRHAVRNEKQKRPPKKRGPWKRLFNGLFRDEILSS